MKWHDNVSISSRSSRERKGVWIGERGGDERRAGREVGGRRGREDKKERWGGEMERMGGREERMKGE